MRKYDVFISYSRKDTAVADKVCAAFDSVGITYFIDRQGIGGGFEFPKVLAQNIINSHIFLLLASKNAYESRFTTNEIIFAFNKKDKNSIFPYIIDNSELPLDLEFTFAGINRRYITQHPIETTLVDDILNILGRERERVADLSLSTPHNSTNWHTTTTTNDSTPNKEKKHKRYVGILGLLALLVVAITGLFLFIRNTNSVDPDPVETQEYYETYLDGNIGKSLAVKMYLKHDGDNCYSGWYYYLKYGSKNRLTLQGTISNGTLRLEEYSASGERTGTFEGAFDGSSYSGNFYVYTSKKRYNFTLYKK